MMIRGKISRAAWLPLATDRIEAGARVQIKALIFDMDGLLVDTEHLAYAAMDAFLAKHEVERRQDIHDQMLGRRLPEAIAIVKEGYGLHHPLDDLIADYTIMRRDTLIGNVRPLPGALEAVQFGHDAGSGWVWRRPGCGIR